MDLLPSSEQEQIIDSVRAFLSDRLPVTRLHGRTGPPAAMADEVWREAIELGFLSMGLPEAMGGVGYGLIEEVLVSREIGRVVGPARFPFGVVAAKIAAAAGDGMLTRRILGGEVRAGYAAQEDFAGPADALGRRRVYDGVGADLAIAADGDRFRLLDIAGHTFAPSPCIDRSVSMAIGDLSAAPVLADITSAPIRLAASLLTGAMLLGLAEATRTMIAEYAKIRFTFGKAIGSYQAVRHPCAEMEARCELAEAQLFYAALAIMEASPDAEAQAGAARLLTQNAAMRNVDDNIQLHGGIGVTDEFNAHFFLKRAHVASSWFGDRRAQTNRLLNVPLAA